MPTEPPWPRGRLVLLLAAAAAALLACAAGARQSPSPLPLPPPPTATPAPALGAQLRVDGDAIVFEGQINPRSAAEFLRLLQTRPRIRRLVIDSQGGGVAAALDMAEAIHARGLDIEVPGHCYSSCANYIFPAARRKTLGRPEAVAWHGTMTHVMYLQQTGQAQWTATQIEGARMLARREQAFYRGIAVDAFVGWFGKIAPYSAPGLYSLPLADLARFGIGDVMVRNPVLKPPNPAVLELHVDWGALDAIRPTVELAPE